MKKKVIIGITNFLVVIILVLLITSKKDSGILQGSYQSETHTPVVQLVIDDNNFTEYTNSKITGTGTILNSKENAYVLSDGEQKLFLYKDGKTIFYFNPNFKEDVIILKKITDIPTYIKNE